MNENDRLTQGVQPASGSADENCDLWVFIKDVERESYGFCSKEVYVNPALGTAKIEHFEITYWSHHDESETEEYEEPISVEEALALVYPDRKAIEKIQTVMNRDYASVIEGIEDRYRLPCLSSAERQSYPMLDIRAALLEEGGRRTAGRLTMTKDRFRFTENGGAKDSRCIEGALRRYGLWNFSATFSRHTPYYDRYPEERILYLYLTEGQAASSLQFWIPPESAEAYYTFSEAYKRIVERFIPYQTSFAEGCAESRWPRVVHPFFQKRDLNGSQTLELFKRLLEKRPSVSEETGEKLRRVLTGAPAAPEEPKELLRRFLFSPLPWTAAAIELRQEKDLLTLTQTDPSCTLRITETEDAIELRYTETAQGDPEAARRTEELRYLLTAVDAEKVKSME